MTPAIKPKTDNLYRVFRGGAWYGTSATNVRAAYRYDYAPMDRYNFIGFRCAQRGCRQILRGTSP